MKLRIGTVICGIDLAGSKTRPTGVCILHQKAQFHTVYTDNEILSLIHHCNPSVVAVDAPLSFHGEPFRDGDLELRKDYPILPLTFRGMRQLAQRGMNFTSRIDCQVIEVYPHAAKKILGIEASEDLIPYKFTTLPSTVHELDAAAAALTGKYYLEKAFTVYGTEDPIIVPQPSKSALNL